MAHTTCVGVAWSCACECIVNLSVELRSKDIDYTYCSTPHACSSCASPEGSACSYPSHIAHTCTCSRSLTLSPTPIMKTFHYGWEGLFRF